MTFMTGLGTGSTGASTGASGTNVPGANFPDFGSGGSADGGSGSAGGGSGTNGEGGFVCACVAFDGNLRRHAAHRKGAAAVAGLDEEERIGVQECVAHHHLAAIGQHVFRVLGKLLDEREDVVPTTAVQTG